MTSLFSKLFAKAPAPQPREPTPEDYRVGVVLMGAIEKQLAVINLRFQEVPPSGPYATAEARGTLIGIAFGVLQGEGIELTPDRIADTVIAAFVFTYGDPIGRDLAAQTFEEFKAQEPTVLRTSEFARLDMLGVYESGGITSCAAFSLATAGMI